ncbi:MAG: DNA repair protein RecN [Bacteroidales bacterium]|nr:DNA repair protein RecN [Bacteroidales bacterium]
MLTYLSIENYALIDKLELQFSDKMNIITGETGAGKSILVGALSLVLGHRADTSVLRNKDKKCIVEAHFNITNYNISDFFQKHELDFEPVSILRREITPNNKSRAFINDTPVNNNILKDLTSFLIDIHSQHHSLSLFNWDYQLDIIDDFAQSGTLLKEYKSLYLDFREHQKKMQLLVEKNKTAKGDADYNRFLFEELDSAHLEEGEQEEIEAELKILNNAEEIKRKLNNVNCIFNNEPHDTLAALKEIINNIREIEKYVPEYEEILKRLESSIIELKDIASELERYEHDIIYSEERIEELNSRLNQIYHLQKKHKVLTVQELINIKEALSETILALDNFDEQIILLETQLKKEEYSLRQLAENLNDKRQNNKKEFERKITAILHDLAMPEAVFKVDIKINNDLSIKGFNSLNFLFSANKGSSPDVISKVASGGELSRLMLAIKSVVSQNNLLPSIIFDEIDSGISGEIAVKTSRIIQNMSQNMQIIAITHLPQIARIGDTHFEVFKQSSADATHTHVRKLTSDERISTIAAMISGEKVTEAAMITARELLKING